MFSNRKMYECARLIRFTIKRKKDVIHNLVVLCDNDLEFTVIDLFDLKNFLRKGKYCVVGYFDYIPSQTNLDLQNIMNEVFNYECV